MVYALSAVAMLLWFYFCLWLVLTKPWQKPVDQALNKKAEANQAFQQVFIELFEEQFEHNFSQLKPWEATDWTTLYSIAAHSSTLEAVRKAKEKTNDERMLYELEELVRDVAYHLSVSMARYMVVEGAIRGVTKS